jgi:hypothetical protein
MGLVLDSLKTKHKITSGYRPQTNGLVERANKSITEKLRVFASDFTSDWDILLPFAVNAYNNSTINSATGYTPFYVLHGYEPRTWLDAELDLNLLASNSHVTDDLMLNAVNIQQRMKSVRDEVRDRNAKIAERRAKQRGPVRSYKIGDLAWFLIPRPDNKLSDRAVKCTIINKFAESGYIIRRLDDSTAQNRIAYVGQLRPVHFVKGANASSAQHIVPNVNPIDIPDYPSQQLVYA